MTAHTENHDLVDSLYAVAMEPERFSELVDVWQKRLLDVKDTSFPIAPQDFEFLHRHIARANSVLALTSQNENLLPQPLMEKLA